MIMTLEVWKNLTFPFKQICSMYWKLLCHFLVIRKQFSCNNNWKTTFSKRTTLKKCSNGCSFLSLDGITYAIAITGFYCQRNNASDVLLRKNILWFNFIEKDINTVNLFLKYFTYILFFVTDIKYLKNSWVYYIKHWIHGINF